MQKRNVKVWKNNTLSWIGPGRVKSIDHWRTTTAIQFSSLQADIAFRKGEYGGFVEDELLPKHIILIADTVRLEGRCQFHLPTDGTMKIVCRNLIYEEDSKLTVLGDSKELTIETRNLIQGKSWENSVIRLEGTYSWNKLNEHFAEWCLHTDNREESVTRQLRPAEVPAAIPNEVWELQRKLVYAQSAVSLAALLRANDDRKAIVEVFQRMEFTALNPNDRAFVRDLGKVLFPPIYQTFVEVTVNQKRQSVSIVYKGKSADYYIVPGKLLVEPEFDEGPKGLKSFHLGHGFYHGQNASSLTLSFRLRLVVDSVLINAVKNSGLTGHCLGSYDANKWIAKQPAGLQSFQFVSYGNRLLCLITAQTADPKTALLLEQICSEQGVALEITSNDSVVTQVPLTFTRWGDKMYRLSSRQITAKTWAPAKIEYSLSSEGEPMFHASAKALPEKWSRAPFTYLYGDEFYGDVPAEAVIYEVGNLENTLKTFVRMNASQPGDKIRILHTLTNRGPKNEGQLLYIDTKVSLVDVTSGPTGLKKRGIVSPKTIRLAPWPALGSDYDLAFPNNVKGELGVLVEATAKYQHGTRKFRFFTFRSIVQISEDSPPEGAKNFIVGEIPDKLKNK